MKRIFSIVFALLLLPVMALGALAADVPEPSADFYVYDGAGTLSESTKDLILNASGPLEQYCDGAQIVVVTIDYLPRAMTPSSTRTCSSTAGASAAPAPTTACFCCT